MLAAQRAMGAYAKVGLETSTMGASPHQLIQMLFDGARSALAIARHGIERHDLAEKGRAITRAMTIVGEGLRGSLDLARGGEVAANLDALYAYMEAELIAANLHNDARRIEAIDGLLALLQSAWSEIARPAVPVASATAATAEV
ncbi:MAG TPA: flagellar export chaperone FliS [Burkholderiaceae bacterium]|jgi:flagellar protein FliS|nr:flagellar export chaperone FliS [Burkholderiaceae bacterium]